MIEVKINGVVKWQVNEYTFVDPQMGLRSISLTVTHPSDNATVPSFVGAYVEYEGERYDIVNSKPTAEKGVDSINYKYNLIFSGQEAELQKRKIRNLATVGVDTFISQGTSFSLYADINQFKQLLENNLKYYFGSKWTINLGSTTSESVMVSVNNMFIWDLLLKTFEYYGLRWNITGNTINIGYTPDVIQHVFDYGYSGGLVKITRTAQSEPTINRLIGVGGSRNVPINYFTNRYSDFPVDPNPISGDVNIKNIMPKVFRDSVIAGTLPYIDYVEDAALVAVDGVKEDALEPNEEIYPSIAGVEVTGLGRIDQIIAASVPTANTPDDAGYSPTFDIWVKDIGFDLADNQYTATQDAKISFTSGMLAGYEFVILATNGVRNVVVDTSKSYGGVSSKYKITLINSSEDFTATGRVLPNSVIKAMAGDSFVIYDIIMPQTYVELAELRVQNWLKEQLLIKKVEKPTYAIEPTDTFFEENIAPESDGKTIREKLKSGNKLTVNNTKVTDGAQELHINNITIQYGGLLPKYSFMVTDKVSVQGSAIARLTNEIQKTDNSVQDTDKKIVKLQQYSDRQWKEIQETITLLGAAIDGFSTGINPITVQTMQLLVGNESLQFRFVSSKTTPVAVSHAFNWDDVLKSFTTTSGIIQHMTLGITEISSNHPVSAYKFWDIASYSNNTLVAEKPYYLYAKCSRATSGAVFLLSDVPIGMYDDANYYYFLTGILNSENSDGGRSFVSLYGFTEILPGRITTDKIVSSDGLTYFDLLNGVIGGKIRFVSGGSQTDLSDWASDTESSINSKSANFDAQPTKYRKNDTWTLSADTTVNGTAYKSGEILTATQDSTTFVEAHWIKRVRYTDDTAVNNLEIGGRNLRTGTYSDWRVMTMPAEYGVTTPLFAILDDWRGKTVTHAFEVKDVPAGEAVRIRIDFHTNASDYVIHTSGSIVYIEGKSYVTYTIPADTQYTMIRMRVAPVSYKAPYNFLFRGEKLEFGNKPTDWTESQEDVQAKIDAAKTEAENAAQAYADAKSEAERVLAEAYADGKVSAEEQARIDDVNAKLAAAKAYAEAQDALLKTQQEAYADGVANEAELAAIAVAEAKANLARTEAEAYADGKVSAEEARAIADANAKLAAAQNYADNLPYVRRNLAQRKDILAWKDLGSINLTEGTDSVEGNYYRYTFGALNGKELFPSIKFKENTRYTLSVKTILESGNSPYFTFYYTDGTEDLYVFKYADASPTAKAYTTRNNKTLASIKHTHGSNGYVKLFWVNIVEGTKAVLERNDAPEDAKLTAEQAQLQADGYMRARYVRDWSQGYSTNANANHWKEIQVFNKAGVNLAKNKIPTTNGTPHASYPLTNATDEDINTTAINGYGASVGASLDYLRIDLGQVYYDIDFIKIIHGIDGRTTYGTKTEISEDGINWTTIFDSAIEGTYKETEEGKIHTQRYASVISKLNQSKAITDKFGTTIDNGLVATVLLLLREYNSTQSTSGLSGIQKDANGIANQPSYWSGGTHEQAQAFVPFVKKLENEQSTSLAEYNNLPSIVFLHNGAAKIGHFIVLTSGEILIVDPSTGSVKLKFTTAELPSIADLVTGTNSQGSTPVGAGSASKKLSQIVSGSTLVSKSGATATFDGVNISINGTGMKQPNGMASFAEATLYARRNGVRTQRLASVTIYFTSEINEYNTANINAVPYSFPVDAGTYTFELVITTTGLVNSANSTTSSSNFSWKHTVAGVKKQQYSKDGMMFFYSNRHFYFNELTGLDVKESAYNKFEMPGVLAAGSVSSDGVQANVWGAKSNPAGAGAISGGRSVPLANMKHDNYVVQITPHTATTFRVGTKTTSSFQAIGTGGFDYVVIGNNY